MHAENSSTSAVGTKVEMGKQWVKNGMHPIYHTKNPWTTVAFPFHCTLLCTASLEGGITAKSDVHGFWMPVVVANSGAVMSLSAGREFKVGLAAANSFLLPSQSHPSLANYRGCSSLNKYIGRKRLSFHVLHIQECSSYCQ